ncbi:MULTISPECIES: DUF885 domain-containing protein [unclassified Luteococcus]|uniref:DUF885 domain-containing protein n=1 Tax=unclassified Luteococcus TaxID=2639923 RepID=UPI00313E0802
MSIPNTASVGGRPSTPIDEIANAYFEGVLRLSPCYLTSLGRPERQDEYDDFSPAGLAARAALNRETLGRLAEVSPVDDIDRVTLAAMRERLGLDLEIFEAGADLLSINNIATSLHVIRGVYDQMPTATEEDWRVITRRLRAVPAAVDGWAESQRAAVERGLLPARRQVNQLAEQLEQWTATGGFLDGLRSGARLADQMPLAPELAAELSAAVEVARGAFSGAAELLRGELHDAGTDVDGVGVQRYRLMSRASLGANIDLTETYRWGLAEVARIQELERQTAERIKPGASIAEAVELLDADENYRLHGTDALREWMQGKADEAVTALADVHFDIPEPVRRIECCIAPTTDGGIYYTGPSEDFSRPGRMWWAVPEDVQDFSTWRELTTVYHEGVPGHHLQIGQTAYRSELLNLWRRHGCWVSGHGEGWALYAEWLMADLGFQDDPGNLMGLLDGQMLRAVRVVIDIGLHCGAELGLTAPELVGGGEWTFDKAWAYFNRYVFMDEGFARFEVNRYCGWPGQAPSYKLGERLWLQLRDEVRAAQGEAFSLKDFHRTALDIGGVGLDVLREAVLAAYGAGPALP